MMTMREDQGFHSAGAQFALTALYPAGPIRYSLPAKAGSSAPSRPVHAGWKLRLPAALVSFRAALGPGIVLISQRWRNGIPLAVCIVMALVSDSYDGVLARRWPIDTENLRRWDTRAGTLFYACVLIVVFML
jgi:phosphatidylglycerophosphate synthase